MNKAKYILLSLLLIVAVSFAGCVSKTAIEEQNQKFTVVASFYPVYAIANYIMQGSVSTDLINLTNNNQGVCLHNYTLLPDDMATIEGADVFLTCGDDITSNVDVKNKVDIGSGLPEHCWMNLDDANQLAQTIANTLADKDWANKTTYLENADNFSEAVKNEEASISGKVNSLSNKSVISLDDSLTVFAQGIGLSTITSSTSSEANEGDLSYVPPDVADMATNAEQAGTSTIITLNVTDNDELNVITGELTDSGMTPNSVQLSAVLSGDSTPNDYFNQIDSNFNSLFSALSE